jgi:hypothetical protein
MFIGKFHEEDIKEAYKCLNFDDVDVSTVSDEFLIDTYSVLVITYILYFICTISSFLFYFKINITSL